MYVKPYHNDDMSVYVKKVHFRLHDSYANQVLTCLVVLYCVKAVRKDWATRASA